MTLPISVSRLLSDKRLRKKERRDTRSRKRLDLVILKRAVQKMRFGERSQIIRRLADACTVEPLQQRHGVTNVKIPKVFSIIEDPMAAISTLVSFAKALTRVRCSSIYFDQSKIETYDLAAMALLDIVATEIDVEARQQGRRMRFAGAFPKRPAIKRFVRSMGLIRHLKIGHEEPTGDEMKKIRLFDRRNRHYYAAADPTRADFKSRTIAGFVDHVNSCLSDHNRQLTHTGVQELCDYIGEILGNAEEHPGFVDWTIQGYLDNSLTTPICEIAIFNFGKSIAQTLKELPSEHYTYKQIWPYVVLHHGSRKFSYEWRQSDLLTLMALQGHVSSKNNSVTDTRGQGMGDLIDFFQQMHSECGKHSAIDAKMAILSGSTYILFDGKYKMRESVSHGRVIAFNAQNDLYTKPDHKYVRSLGKLHFPGTVISIRFPLSVHSSLTKGEN